MRPITLLRPGRRREIERPFGWLPCRFLTEGWLAKLSTPAKLLYLLLCLAADRRGLSWYGDARIAALLDLGLADLAAAQTELLALDLVDFDGRVYQVLSLPPPPPRSASASPPPRQPGPAESEQLQATAMPEQVRLTLRRLFDRY